jgi:hypothetical protein
LPLGGIILLGCVKLSSLTSCVTTVCHRRLYHHSSGICADIDPRRNLAPSRLTGHLQKAWL